MVKRAEAMNVEWITVHGRTPSQKSETPVNVEAVKLVCNILFHSCSPDKTKLNCTDIRKRTMLVSRRCPVVERRWC